MLKSSSNPRVLIGKDDWLFFVDPADGNSFEDYRRNDPLSPGELRDWKIALQAKYRWLKQRGIQYLFVIAPDKHSIYGEYIPSRVRQVGKQSRFDQLLEYMHGSKVPILDLRPALLQAKTKGLLYYKTDTHWNDLGAAVAQYEIMRHLAKYDPNLHPTDYRVSDFSLLQHSGDIANMLNLSSYLKEMAPRLRRTLPPCNKQIAEGAPDNPNRAFFTDWAFFTECRTDGPRALIFRDSFFTYLQPYIAQYFSKTFYVWVWPDFNQLEQYLEYHAPNIVIEERVERGLKSIPAALPTPKNKAYHLFYEHWFQTGAVVYRLADQHQDELTGRHQLTITPTGESYTLLSHGNDPYFFLPEFKKNDAMQYIMKINLSAPKETNWQIFYGVSGALQQPQHDEKHSISGQLQPGENTFYVVLGDKNLQGQIRVDPGSVMGEYILKSLEIREVKRQ
jgi:alginate O-acetyltransferase complex protein AlgJ